jgi:DNA-binding NtrC family response regulator
MALRIFIVDDDPDYASLLRFQLKKLDPLIETFGTGEAALDALDPLPDLVFLDLVMPGQGGLETLRQLHAEHPRLPVVVVSSQAVVSVAFEALRLGAYDYVTKGVDDTVKIASIAGHIAERAALAAEVEALREQLPTPHGIPGLIGESAAMARVLRTLRKTLKGDLAIAIVGESGTGKELAAHAIHFNSARRREPLVVVNCAAIPYELMESEFFGHEKGSFTGAHMRKTGKFEQANRGTIFLDEIGELNLSLQAKLLRVLQNQEVQRVGGNETIRVDVRVICATNRDVVAMTRTGTFREDLYYRLFQFPVLLPPLRERDQDALLLAEHFRKTFLALHRDIEPRPFSANTRRRILSYPWPGNVRQLKNAVERALLLSETPAIEPDDLMLDPIAVSDGVLPAGGPPARPPGASPGPAERILETVSPEHILPIEELKRLAIEHAYRLCKGNIDQTSIRLGVTRSTIYRLMEKYKMEGREITL